MAHLEEGEQKGDRRRLLRRAGDVPDRRMVLRRHSDWESRRLWKSVAVGYLILLTAVTVALYALEKRDTRRLHAAAAASCQRVNYLREQDNANALVVYGALYSGAQREYRLWHTVPDSKQERVHHIAYDAYVRYYSALRHTQLTDCRLAVDHVERYNPPLPIPFEPSDLKK
jgi:hypothetical protein